MANEPRFASVPGTRQSAQDGAIADDPRGQRPEPDLVLGHDLFADHGGGALVSLLPDSRSEIVGWEVHETRAEHAAHLVRHMALAEGIAPLTDKPVLHGGSTLKATPVLSMLNWLGVKPSYSRPRLSDDNAYAQALFRTAKYRLEFPLKGFADLQAARAWAANFVY